MGHGSAVTEFSQIPLMDLSVSLSDHLSTTDPKSSPPLGIPSCKRTFEIVHISATILSWVCLITGIISVTPDIGVAWWLRSSGQLVVLGFLLGIMNICTSTVVPRAMIAVESHCGPSTIQNYDALLTARVLAPKTSLIWRATIAVFIALPLGLSVAYKRCLGGISGHHIDSNFPLYYGIDFPRTGSWAPPNNAIHLLTESTSAFLSASQYVPQPYPNGGQFPVSYGYNTLLLSKDSAAILDIPTQSTVTAIQQTLKGNETWDITARVKAYVAIGDNRSDFKTDNTIWQLAVNTSTSLLLPGLDAMYLYSGSHYCIGVMPTGRNDICYIGIYKSPSIHANIGNFPEPTDEEYHSFRDGAYKFDISRAMCQGHWRVNSSSIILIDGSCGKFPTLIDSSILQEPQMELFVYDYLPVFGNIFGAFVNAETRADESWIQSSYAIGLVTAYWARALYMLQVRHIPTNYTGPYESEEETITSTRSTLDSSGWHLYLILAFQPVITLFALIVIALLRNSPVSSGFGLVSILSGFQPETTLQIGGAGLSGKLSQPVRLEFTVKEDTDQGRRITNQLTDSTPQSWDRAKTRTGRKYG